MSFQESDATNIYTKVYEAKVHIFNAILIIILYFVFSL